MKTLIITDQSEIEEVINQCDVCYIGMVDAEGKPYTLPYNFAYADNVIYLHSAPFGKKIDILKVNPNVCIVFSNGHDLHFHDEEVGCSYSMKFKSIIVYGHVEFTDDIDEKTIWMNKVMQKYTGRDFTYSLPAIKNVACFKVVIDKITARKRGY